MIYKNIAEYAENDSELAKFTILELHKEIERLELRHKIQTKRIKQLMGRLEKHHDKDKKILHLAARIIDYGHDYDGFENTEDLKGLIDMLVDYAIQIQETL